MELLERDLALATLAGALDSSKRGEGRVVLVTGEPGIGKTWLVRQFLQDLGEKTKVLLGTCDDLSIPRPLGPIRDLAGSVSPALATALSDGSAPHDIQTLLIDELELPPSPTVLVIEDVHWADDATLDSITVLGRRIGSLPALLILTFRAGEAPLGHRLHATVGAIPASSTEVIELAPLSERAVTALAGDDAVKVYAATGGNPFYVSELLASPSTAKLPPSVANAVLGRASRLDDDARRLVELVSVVPGRVKTSLLDAVMPDWAAAAEEPERRQLLEVDPAYVHFRHELARHAVRSSLPIAARRRLHADMLDVLLAAHADPADIVHHAEAAGDQEVVAEYALVAARRAAALESRREAYSNFRRAAAFLDQHPAAEQATILEELGTPPTWSVGSRRHFSPLSRPSKFTTTWAMTPQSAGAPGCCPAFTGSPATANAPRRRHSNQSQFSSPSGNQSNLLAPIAVCRSWRCSPKTSIERCCGATERSNWQRRLGHESTRAHALGNIGAAKLQVDLGAAADLVEAHEIADAAGDRYEAARALNNLGYTMLTWVQPDLALRYAEQTKAYADKYEVHNLSSYAASLLPGWTCGPGGGTRPSAPHRARSTKGSP